MGRRRPRCEQCCRRRCCGPRHRACVRASPAARGGVAGLGRWYHPSRRPLPAAGRRGAACRRSRPPLQEDWDVGRLRLHHQQELGACERLEAVQVERLRLQVIDARAAVHRRQLRGDRVQRVPAGPRRRRARDGGGVGRRERGRPGSCHRRQGSNIRWQPWAHIPDAGCSCSRHPRPQACPWPSSQSGHSGAAAGDRSAQVQHRDCRGSASATAAHQMLASLSSLDS